MKAISYNIHKGFNIHNTKYLLSDIKSALMELTCDIVFLQEITGLHLDNNKEAQFEFLADSLWPHYAYGKNAVTTKGHHGNAILSRYPINHWHNLNISTNKFEQRGLLHCTINVPQKNKNQSIKLHLFCVHLNLLHQSRLKQMKQIKKYFNLHVHPNDSVIFSGDFNDWSKELDQQMNLDFQLTEAHLEKHKYFAKTFPSIFPILSLDRIYTRNIKINNVITLKSKLWKNLSDHLPLLIDFKLTP